MEEWKLTKEEYIADLKSIKATGMESIGKD